MKRFLTVLIAAVIVSSPSYAAVFEVTGVTDLTGTLTIVGGTVTAADLNYSADSPSQFTNIFDQRQNGTSDYIVRVANGSTSPVDFINLELNFGGTGPGNGGAINEQVFFDCTLTGSGGFECASGESFLPNGTLTATPLPAALPLFATGLGGLGLLGWRGKRKGQAVA